MSVIQPPRRLLYGPGPTMVEPRVYEAMSQPVVGHLDPFFFSVVDDIRAGLRLAFGTSNPFTYAMSGTGSSGMETAVANFVEPGQKLLVFVNGFFADRIGEMGRRHRAEVTRIEKPWGEPFTDDEAREAIRRERPNVVAFVQAETSTGVYTAGRAICEAAHEVDALAIADTVTSLGAMPVEVDANGIDIAYSCTQKGLSAPPGLSPITVSPRAVERLKARTSPPDVWYLDLRLLEEYYDGAHKYHHTAPVSLFYALREALAIVSEEGLTQRHDRHRKAHLELLQGLQALGLTMHVADGHRLWNLNTPRVPDGVSDVAVRKHLMDRYGMEVLGGFGPLAGKIFRIGLMGPLANTEGTRALLDALGEAIGQAK
ncbi:MAG TPA: alanine--glyoxylate aminotransferase family protein [Bryobacteraceae bacterium]|nr:alanine--glyoxylate aminotransferase family protein [Bryobacteraceae bacterium]